MEHQQQFKCGWSSATLGGCYYSTTFDSPTWRPCAHQIIFLKKSSRYCVTPIVITPHQSTGEKRETHKSRENELTSCWGWHPFRRWPTGVVPPSIRNRSRPCRSSWPESSAPSWSHWPMLPTIKTSSHIAQSSSGLQVDPTQTLNSNNNSNCFQSLFFSFLLRVFGNQGRTPRGHTICNGCQLFIQPSSTSTGNQFFSFRSTIQIFNSLKQVKQQTSQMYESRQQRKRATIPHRVHQQTEKWTENVF